jgi:hypothetical protein
VGTNIQELYIYRQILHLLEELGERGLTHSGIQGAVGCRRGDRPLRLTDGSAEVFLDGQERLQGVVRREQRFLPNRNISFSVLFTECGALRAR